MSNKASQPLNENSAQSIWAKALQDLDEEIAADPNLTEAEKRFLLEEMDQLSDEEWEPITCEGEGVSTTIINDRGARGLLTDNPLNH